MTNEQTNDTLPSSQEMLSPSSAVRNVRMRSTDFTWNRFINCYPVDEFKPLTIIEKPNVDILDDLVTYSSDIPDVGNYRQLIKAYITKFRRNGEKMEARYEQFNYSDFKTDDYAGALRVGRAYSRSSLQYMPSSIIKSLYKETHVEVDMKSSYATIMMQLFPELDLPGIKQWVDSPEMIMDDMRDMFGLSRKKTKMMVLSNICSAGASHPNLYSGIENEVVLDRLKSNPFMVQLRRDVSTVVARMASKYPQFMEFSRNIRETRRHDDHFERTALSMLLADGEHLVMRNLIKAMFPDGVIEDVVWRYDGVLVPRTCMGGMDEEQFISWCNRVVEESTGLRVRFGFKGLFEGSIPIAMSAEELASRNPYIREKREFERTHFYCIDRTCYMRIKPDLDLQTMSKEQLKLHLAGRGEFFKQWTEDINKRQYETIGFYPPPLVCPDSHFNLWRGFDAELLPENVNKPDIGPFRRHLKLMAGGEKDDGDIGFRYLENTIAHYLQKPGFKTGISILFTSAQGTGKDLTADILQQVIGHNAMLKVGTLDSVIGSKNVGMLEGKILCVASEVEASDFNKFGNSELKTTITEKRIVSNKKYEQQRVITNLANLWMFSNSSAPIKLDVGERRFQVFGVDGFYAQKLDYFTPLIAMKDDPVMIRGIYDFYSTLDISGFDPRKRVDTEAYKVVTEATPDIFRTFIKQSFKPVIMAQGRVQDGRVFIQTADFKSEWLKFCQTNNYCKNNSEGQIKNSILKKLASDFNNYMDRFKASPSSPSVVMICSDGGGVIHGISHKRDGVRCSSFDVDAMNKAFGFNDPNNDFEYDGPTAMANGFTPGRNN
jgi:hypothetical protein